jgi:hypothetical protein
MATRALIPVEVYLTSVYRPDCDYVDGEVLERNSGEREHSYIQAALVSYFSHAAPGTARTGAGESIPHSGCLCGLGWNERENNPRLGAP